VILALTKRYWIHLALAGALGIWSYTLYQKGKTKGDAEGQRAQLKLDGQEVDQQIRTVRQDVSDSGKRVQEARRKQAGAQVKVERSKVAVDALKEKAEQARDVVAKLPTEQLEGDIKAKIDFRAESDTSPGFYEEELRAIDLAVTQFEILSDTVDELEDQVGDLEFLVAWKESEIEALADQSQALLTFGNQMVGHYTRAYNAAQPRCSVLKKIFTIGFGCAKKRKLPDPITLTVPTP
jgi:chromosome segregation ATPase